MRLAGYAQRWLPASGVIWLKDKRKAWLRRNRARMQSSFIQKHGSFTADQLVSECRAAGVKENGILFVQCSYNDLVSYTGTAYGLLTALREIVGPNGTLLMPAYSTNMYETPCRLFDVAREPTHAGILAELFRREEGVVRSLHPRHSICALGPHASELLADHHKCVYANGPDSPFDRLSRMRAQSLCLGLRPGFHSFVHWVTDIEPEKYPVSVHEGPFDCLLRDRDGAEMCRPFYRHPEGRINKDWLIARNLGPNAMRSLAFHGVSVCLYSWPELAAELLALRDRGIVCIV